MRIHDAICCLAPVLLLGACATQPQGGESPVTADANEAPETVLLAVQEEGEPRMVCRVQTRPGSRIVVGEVCEPADRASGARVDFIDESGEWELEISEPGVYILRRVDR